jgi:isoleucyl-tRNA synthetase
MEDMRCSDEILLRVSEGYRKLRNTARFALGNLDGFEPERDAVADEELMEIDRWALGELDSVIARVRAAYDAYEFHLVYQILYEFCTVTLSARYFDILKDRLYTFAPRNPARRAAQTALYRIVESLARMLATLLVFTADEIWENLPGNGSRSASVHLARLPDVSGQRDEGLAARWATIFVVRDEVMRALEEARDAKLIGSSLEAHIGIETSGVTYDVLEQYRDQLRYVFIVSGVTLKKRDLRIKKTGITDVTVNSAEGQKCERCWNYSTHVGEFSRYPTVCERCIAALEEIEAGGGLS